MKITLTLTALLAVALTGSAYAHVTANQDAAAPGSYHKVVLTVPHGCDGEATTGLRVKIPDGVINIKPQVKAGWDITTKTVDYDHSYTLHGAELTQGVGEIAWGNGHLDDAYFDEFAFQVYLTDDLEDTDAVYFPTIQQCGDKTTRWIDTSDEHSNNPAPKIELTP